MRKLEKKALALTHEPIERDHMVNIFSLCCASKMNRLLGKIFSLSAAVELFVKGPSLRAGRYDHDGAPNPIISSERIARLLHRLIMDLNRRPSVVRMDIDDHVIFIQL